ncbi:cupin domain-containing protein [Rapidithrix thailandica]|uniref:Cupin domain-containing protein n=1 Tax=Rapidithrix thailandica TaxID=413964 RepID=A0AAW9S8L8_9BACT
MKVKNIPSLLAAAKADKTMNRKVAFVTGDESSSLYIIELSPKEFLPAHYHKKGIEIYYILSGEASISYRNCNEKDKGKTITRKLSAGDAISIYPDVIHQITNTSENALQVLGTAPQSHNSTDRFFVEG